MSLVVREIYLGLEHPLNVIFCLHVLSIYPRIFLRERKKERKKEKERENEIKGQ